jgi:preprotein translocase subunit YajC
LGSFGLLALYVVGFIAIFYFLAIRPQQRQRKAHDALVSSVKRGDRIISVGGIHGKVKRTEEAIVVIEIAKGVDINLSRKAIAEVISDAVPAAMPDEIQAAEPEESEEA